MLILWRYIWSGKLLTKPTYMFLKWKSTYVLLLGRGYALISRGNERLWTHSVLRMIRFDQERLLKSWLHTQRNKPWKTTKHNVNFTYSSIKF